MKKKVITSLLLILLIIPLSGCQLIDKIKDRTAHSIKDNIISTVKPNIEEKVLVDDGGVKVVAKSLDYDESGTKVKVAIENNTSDDIEVYINRASVNGIMVEAYLIETINAGMKANKSISIFDEDLKNINVDTIVNMQFEIEVKEAESYDNIIKPVVITLKTNATDYEQKYNFDGKLLYEKDDIKLYVGNLKKGYDGGAELTLYIDNGSDKNIVVSDKTVSINGYMVEGLFIEEVFAGMKAYGTLYIEKEDLDNNSINSISDIENIDVEFKCYTDEYDTIFNTDKLTISFN